jgi:TrmH family RNA methyltransferase
MGDEGGAGFRQVHASETFRRIRRLQASRGYRDGQGLFFVEGIRLFVQAVDHHFKFETLIYSEKLLISPIARKFVRQLKRSVIPFARVSPEQFRSVSHAEHASGVGAILRQPTQTLENVEPAPHTCWTVLLSVRSPGNFGTLMRTSAAIGASGFILLGNEIDPYDPRVVRASMGSLFQQSLVRATVEQFRHWARIHGLQPVGVSPDGAVEYNQARYPDPNVILLGEERSGLSAVQRELCELIVRIPMAPGTDSLNLGVAGGLILYEVRSRRQNGS